MNIYFVGMCISMIVYITIGIVISKRVKSVDDYYVAGRRAPVFLIAGSMIASYASTSLFMGDAAQCYAGAFSSLIILATMQVAGYIIGAVFFGRYLRRSESLTIPEFFEKRFASRRLKKLAAITAVATMSVYMLSVTQGIGTLMSAVTNVDYNICIVLALLVVSFVTVISGSSGVLITDTLMASLFTIALFISAFAIAQHNGGWYSSISQIAANPDFSLLLSWSGKPGAVYDSGLENILWGIDYGIVWMAVCMVGPWQSSRYLMAKNEHTVIRSSFISALGIFLIEFVAGMAAVMVRLSNPNMADSSQVLIWAAMNVLPVLLGVILLTGVLAAGISSGTTFLSLVGASMANDILEVKGQKIITVGRISMVILAVIVAIIAMTNPPAIFWITFLGGAIIASSWMPVALASVFCERLTSTGAYCGILAGFLGCFGMKMYSFFSGTSLPVYLDPSIVGIVANVAGMILGSRFSQISNDEIRARNVMLIMPDNEKDPVEITKTLNVAKLSMIFGGVLISIVLIILWVLPYLEYKPLNY